MPPKEKHRGFTLLELVISLVLVIVLLTLLVPALDSARTVSQREQCAENLRMLGRLLHEYANQHNDQLPYAPGQSSWDYGGLRYSEATRGSFLDQSLPLNRWLINTMPQSDAKQLFCCPADYGIRGEHPEAGTGRRTCCRAFGTSYRANAVLFDARLARLTDEQRGMYRSEVTAAPSRLLVLGDAVWYEVYEQTRRDADWHGEPGLGNVLFLDGSVKFQAIRPRGQIGPITLNPFTPAMSPVEPRLDDDSNQDNP
jgi:prepilin-type processing-associated H-X9-DG protein